MGAGSAAYGALFGRTDYEIEEVPIKLERLPAALDGFVITQLSDIHVGMYTGAPELSSAVELTRATRPDLIVLTGDLIDNDDRHAPTLGAWVRRLGGIAPVVAVAGNHDYYSGIAKTLDAVRRAGATVLLNEGVALRDGRLGSREPIRVGEVHPHLSLLGVDDVWAGRYGGPGPDLPRAAATSNPDAARLLLCHNPSSFDSFAPDIDLQLSGHTHGGQVNLGIRPADYVLPHGYVAGHYRFGRAQLYVNRGFGTVGPPARLGAAPEVTKVVLTT